MFTFWPLAMIKEEYEIAVDKDFIGFCDFLLASHCIGFRKSVKGIHKDYSKAQNDLNSFAQTFEEAVAMINSSSDLIY